MSFNFKGIRHKNNNIDLNNEALWRAFKEGDINSFEKIYNVFSEQLIRYGLKMYPVKEVVEDCLHDLFIELWSSKARLTNVQNIQFYLVKAMRNKLNAALKQKQKITQSLFDNKGIHEMISGKIGESNSSDSNEEKIKNTIYLLSPRQKEVIYLYFYLSYTISQIAEILEINYQSVANLLQRSIASIRKRIIVVFIFTFFSFF